MSSALYSELSASARAKPKGVSLGTHRGDRIGLGQGCPVADGPVLHPTVGVMDQAGQVSSGSFPLRGGHLKGVQGQVGVQAGGGLPPHDPPREHVGDKGDVHPPREGAHVSDVGDPQFIRGEGLEMAPDQLGRALLPRPAARGARGLGAPDTVQTQVAREPHGRYTGPHDRRRDARQSQGGPASRASCKPPAPSSWFL